MSHCMTQCLALIFNIFYDLSLKTYFGKYDIVFVVKYMVN